MIKKTKRRLLVNYLLGILLFLYVIHILYEWDKNTRIESVLLVIHYGMSTYLHDNHSLPDLIHKNEDNEITSWIIKLSEVDYSPFLGNSVYFSFGDYIDSISPRYYCCGVSHGESISGALFSELGSLEADPILVILLSYSKEYSPSTIIGVIQIGTDFFVVDANEKIIPLPTGRYRILRKSGSIEYFQIVK